MIFLFCRKATADVPFGFVVFQKLLYLTVKVGITLPQPLRQILMHRRLGNTEPFCRGPDRGAVFDDVHGQLAGPFFHVVCQKATLPAHRSMKMYAQHRKPMQKT